MKRGEKGIVSDLEALRQKALAHLDKGELEEATEAFGIIASEDPGSADGWINLASAERELGRLPKAVEHFRKGLVLLRTAPGTDRSLVSQTFGALGATLQTMELTGEALAAFREAARADPRAPQPLAAQASLLARAGQLEEADKAATAYCLAAVSVLSEKENIGAVRRFQKAMKAASTVDGGKLLAATREAYVNSFDETAAKLPTGVRLEEEPFARGEGGKLVPALGNPARPFSRVRFDAIHPQTGQRWMIQERPTYGYPRDCLAASEGFFTVPLPEALAPFRAYVATRTAWDYFFVRIRFVNGLRESTVERAEKLMGEWYLMGFTGEFGEATRGFFHFIAEPFAIGDEGLRYEIDLGRSGVEAFPALIEALCALHLEEPIEVVTFGDAALPTQR